jgi:hypothetical protein
MRTWAKRGFQTALVTGGLLMLGTGIASADENVDPDRPASPLDLNANVPVDIDDNAIGGIGDEYDLPGYHGEVSTKSITDSMHRTADSLREAAGPARELDSPLSRATGKVTELTDEAGQHLPVPTAARQDGDDNEVNEDTFKDNKIDGDLTVPIQICGNAVGVVGDAKVDGSDCEPQVYENHDDITADGSHSGIAGNVVAFDWALPVQVAGNAGGVLGGSGYTTGYASQSVTETGNVSTDGAGSGASGNVLAPQFATPVQVTGNAVSDTLGNAYSDYEAETEAEAGGWIETHGNGSSVSGNVGAVPLALPLKANGNAIALKGSDADASSTAEADAKAGAVQPARANKSAKYVLTDGDNSFLAGNIVQPQGAGIGTVDGNAVSWIGNATTGGAKGGQSDAGSSSSEAEAGGGTSLTSGTDSAGSGNVLDAPIALPVEAFGIGASYIGNAHAAHKNETEANAGGRTITNGTGSFLSANTVAGQVASTAEAFGIGGTHIGNASGTAIEEKEVKAGGYNGTLGNDSSGSGNLVQVPVALPAEVFGVGGSFVGQGSGSADETKVVEAGGGGNTVDDNGAGSSNLLATPISLPAQVFGIGGSLVGQGHGAASTDTESTAGGDYHATGKKGSLAGNLGQVPVSLPAQAHGLGGAVAGNGSGVGDNLTDSQAGGDNDTDGSGGSLAGNIAQVPFAGAATLFGDGAVLGGLADGLGYNEVTSVAGGDSTTSGNRGSVAGNVLSAQGLPIAQVFGNAASVLGVADADAANTTAAVSGGDIATSGIEGALSGNIFDVPTAAVGQVFGNAASVGGVAEAVGLNSTYGKVGGETETEGDRESLSGIDTQVPFAVIVQLYDVPFEVLANAQTETLNYTGIDIADGENVLDLPLDGSELKATDLPRLPATKDGLSGLTSGGLSELGGDTLPTENLLGGGLPTEKLLGGGLPTEGLLGGGLPTENLLGGGLPTEGLLGGGLPTENLLGGGLPTEKLLGGGLPTEGLLGGGLPTEGLLGGGLPTENLLGGGLPTEGLLGGGLPTENLLGGGLPTEGLLGGRLDNAVPVNQDVLPTELLDNGLSTENLGGVGGLNPDFLPTELLDTEGLTSGKLPVDLTSLAPQERAALPTEGVTSGTLPVDLSTVEQLLDTAALPVGELGGEVPALQQIEGAPLFDELVSKLSQK